MNEPPLVDSVFRDVVVVGASAGGVESLSAFVRGLPADLPATVLIVLHVPASGSSALPRILARAGRLPVRVARGGEGLRPGIMLVAPPDRHLLIIEEQVKLSRGPRENGHRPAADVLFRSAARALGQRVVAVVLSGAMDDGTAGSLAVQQRGGAVVAQSPQEASYPSMPASVIESVPTSAVAAAADLGSVVVELCRTPVPRVTQPLTSGLLDLEVELADLTDQLPALLDGPGTPASFGCPDCNGSMFRIDDPTKTLEPHTGSPCRSATRPHHERSGQAHRAGNPRRRETFAYPDRPSTAHGHALAAAR